MRIVYESELYHYGVPGMKWGKRKALNKMLKYEKKMLKYQDEANYQRKMGDELIKMKTGAAKAVKSNINMKGKLGKANGLANAAKSKYEGRASQAATLSALKTANKRGAKAAKAQAKADKWKKKLDKKADKKKINLGNKTVASYMLRQARSSR